MELDRALKLFGLTGQASVGELNATFRRMAKKYHPDASRGNEAVSHERMTRLNLAYETVLTFLTAPGAAADRPTERRAGRGAGASGLDADVRAALSAGVRDYMGLFRRAVSTVQQAVYLYYQYGLENIYLREEGVRRFRYRDSVHRMQSALKQLETLPALMDALAGPLTAAGEVEALREERERLAWFSEFSAALLRSMMIGRKLSSSATAEERTAYGHYHRGSEVLDETIRERLCGDGAPGRPLAGALSVGYHEFMQVITRHYHSSWIAETVIRMHLLELYERGRTLLPTILV